MKNQNFFLIFFVSIFLFLSLNPTEGAYKKRNFESLFKLKKEFSSIQKKKIKNLCTIYGFELKKIEKKEYDGKFFIFIKIKTKQIKESNEAQKEWLQLRKKIKNFINQAGCKTCFFFSFYLSSAKINLWL